MVSINLVYYGAKFSRTALLGLSLVIFLFFLGALLDPTLLDLIKDDLVSLGERFLKTIGEAVLANGTLGLLDAASLGPLVLDEGGAGFLTSSGSHDLVGTLGAGEGVQLLHHVAVLERVLLGLVMSAHGSLDGVELSLDLVRVDDSGEIGAINGVTHELVSALVGTGLSVSAEDLVEDLEGSLGVDHESTNVSTRSEMEEVESIHAAGINTGEVPCDTPDVGVSVVEDDEGSLAHGEARVTVLSLTGTHFLGFADAFEICTGTELFDGGEEGTGAGTVHAVADKGELWHIHDAMSTGKHKRSAGGGSKGGSDGVTLLLGVNLAVPFAPDLERGEHATLSALVTESGLAGTVGTGARNTGNSSNSATCSPGLCGVLVTLQVENTMGLTSVLGHVGMAEGDDIIADGSGEHGGHVGLS